MEEAIKEKLSNVLAEPIEKECQVVYIMVEIRKLLDRFSVQKYNLLRFFCDWILHIEINNLSPAREILNRIAEEHKNGEFGSTSIEFISFDHLRNEMTGFLKEKDINLPTEWLISPEKWDVFRKFFTNIIKDCPLKIKANFKPILIEEFKLTKYDERIENGQKLIDTDWEYKLVDNPTIFYSSITEINKL